LVLLHKTAPGDKIEYCDKCDRICMYKWFVLEQLKFKEVKFIPTLKIILYKNKGLF
jgi:hypothetical protein